MKYWMRMNKYREKLLWLSKLRVKVTLQAINGEKETQQCRGELERINRLIGKLYERGCAA